MDYINLKKRSLRYMGYRGEIPISILKTDMDNGKQETPDVDDSLIEIADNFDYYISELESHINFKCVSFEFEYKDGKLSELNLNLRSNDLMTHFKDCDKVIVIAGTLGLELEKYLRLLQRSKLSKCIIMDAISSAYLEFIMDDYESFIERDRTFRYAPGYGDIPLELNKFFFDTLDLHKKLGVSLTQSNLFIPQKTILGLIGIKNS